MPYSYSILYHSSVISHIVVLTIYLYLMAFLASSQAYIILFTFSISISTSNSSLNLSITLYTLSHFIFPLLFSMLYVYSSLSLIYSSHSSPLGPSWIPWHYLSSIESINVSLLLILHGLLLSS